MERYWFKARSPRYGWYPASWVGWAVVALWAVALMRLTYYFAEQMRLTGDPQNLYWFIPTLILLALALLWVSWAMSAPTRSRRDAEK